MDISQSTDGSTARADLARDLVLDEQDDRREDLEAGAEAHTEGAQEQEVLENHTDVEPDLNVFTHEQLVDAQEELGSISELPSLHQLQDDLNRIPELLEEFEFRHAHEWEEIQDVIPAFCKRVDEVQNEFIPRIIDATREMASDEDAKEYVYNQLLELCHELDKLILQFRSKIENDVMPILNGFDRVLHIKSEALSAYLDHPHEGLDALEVRLRVFPQAFTEAENIVKQRIAPLVENIEKTRERFAA